MKFIYYPLVLVVWLSIFGKVVLWFGQAKYILGTFCSTAHALHLIGFSQPWQKSCKIPGFFASSNFLMHYSNKRLKPTTASVIVRRKKHIWNRYRTNKLSLYGHHVCFCNLCARTASYQHERAQTNCVQPP